MRFVLRSYRNTNISRKLIYRTGNTKGSIRDARSSVKDLVLTVEDIVESDGTVWARSRATGSDPRSGKPVSIYVIDICRFENGKLVEHWGVPDRFALPHQIGALPPKPPSTL